MSQAKVDKYKKEKPIVKKRWQSRKRKKSLVSSVDVQF